MGRWGNKLGGEKRWTFCRSGRVVTEYVQQANTHSKSTVGTLEKGTKYFQS